jgi:hypothetical protein
VRHFNGEKTMMTSFKALLAISAAALLAACGGGSGGNAIDTTTPPANQPEWASPAMFVPAGQSQISVAVSDCRNNSRSVRSAAMQADAVAVPSGTAISSTTLVITSAGDVVLSGALSGSSTVAELVRINFADAGSTRRIDYSTVGKENGFALASPNGDSIETGYDITATLNARNSNYRIYCNTLTNLTPAYAPSEARLPAKFTAGVTSWGDANSRPFTTSTISNNLVVWNNQDSNTTLASNQVNARYASLNISTGALNIGPGTSPANITQSVVLSSALATAGRYQESDYADTDFTSGRTKSVRLEFDTSTQGYLEFALNTGDNILITYPQLGTLNIGPSPVLPAAQ